jgi:hypothetical protein
VCEPLSFGTCGEFINQFERLYEKRDASVYPHPNPMRRNPDIALDADVENDVFFRNAQFPIAYNYRQQDDTGFVVRTFEEQAFHGAETLHDRVFSLVDPLTGKALSVLSCVIDTPLVMQNFNRLLPFQQFKLNKNDELESAECDGKVISLLGPEEFACLQGIKLVLKDKSGTSDEKKKWRFYENGIVNLACGRESGNLAITQVKDDSFNDISFLDKIHWYFINPYNGKAIGVDDNVSHHLWVYSCGIIVRVVHNALHFLLFQSTVRFATYDSLKYAVDWCASKTMQESVECLAVRGAYGWPMGDWLFEDTVTSFYELFMEKDDFDEVR